MFVSFIFLVQKLLLGRRIGAAGMGNPFPKRRKACRRPPYTRVGTAVGAYLRAAGGDALKVL
jgi:hypothetical protein